MAVLLDEFKPRIYFKSSNSKNKVYAQILSPIDTRKVKGIIQFCHGMCEYFDKYMEFYKFMIAQGNCKNNSYFKMPEASQDNR